MASTIIAVGDELLAGYTADTNSHWLAQQLRRLGRPAKRIVIVGDKPGEIVGEIRRSLADAEVEDIYCGGGLGPTTDDITLEAVALALDRDLVEHEAVREKIARHVRALEAEGVVRAEQMREGSLRMAQIPAEPDQVFENHEGMAPGLLYEVAGRRVFVLPGVPVEFRSIFSSEIEPQFLAGGAANAVRELRFWRGVEARFFPVMRDLQTSHPDVAVGSYPHRDTRELSIRCSGPDQARVEEAIDLILQHAAGLGLEPLQPGP